MMKYLTVWFLLLLTTAGLYAADLDYPDVYRALGLPEYENATITELGRDSSSLRDGIKITLFTKVDKATLRKYYEDSMQALEWELQEPVSNAKMRAAGMLDQLPFATSFNKNDMRYQITTSKKDNGTFIHISVIGN